MSYEDNIKRINDTRRIGRMRLSEDALAGVLGFTGGHILRITQAEDSLGYWIMIAHPDMPPCPMNSVVKEVFPTYRAIGLRCEEDYAKTGTNQPEEIILKTERVVDTD